MSSQYSNDSNMFSPAEKKSGADLETRIREFYELARTNSLVIEPETIRYRSRKALYALGAEAFVRLSPSLTGPMTRVRYVEFVDDSTPDPVQVNIKALNLVTTGAGDFTGVDMTQSNGQFGWILIDGYLPLTAPEVSEYPAYFELVGGVLVKVGAGQGAFVKYLRNDLTHFLPMDPGILELQQGLASQLAAITAAQTQLGTLSGQVTGLLAEQVTAAEFETLRREIQGYADGVELALNQTRTISLATSAMRDETQVNLSAIITERRAIEDTAESITAISQEVQQAKLEAESSAVAAIETLATTTVRLTEAGVAAESAITASVSAAVSGDFSEAQAVISQTKATEANDSAAAALLSETVSASWATSSLNSLLGVNPRGMAGGAAWYGGAPTPVFGTDGGVPVIDFTSGGNGDIYPKWAVPAIPGRSYRVHVRARTATGTRQMQIARGSSNALINSSPSYEAPIGTMVFGTSYTTEYLEYTVGVSPATAFQYFFMVVLADSEQLFIQDFWIEDITELNLAIAQAGVATTKAAEASASAASALSSETVAASITPNMRNKDPFMTRWTDIYNLVHWTTYSSTPNRTAGFQAQYSNNQPAAAGVLVCVYQAIPFSPGWWVEEMEVTLNSGTLRGVGIHTNSYTGPNGTGTATEDYSLTDFWSRIGDGVPGRTYRIGVIRQWTVACQSALHYAMVHWTGFASSGGDTSVANDVTIRFCGIRPATEMEIRDKTVLAPLEATVTTQAGAIVDLEGRTEAYWEVTAVAGGRAQIRVFADANSGGGVDIVGDTKISGNLLVTGSVTSGELAANAATRGGITYNAGSVGLTTSWQDAAEVTLTTIGGACKIDFATYIVGQGVGGGTNVQWRLLRNGTEIRIGTIMLFPGEQTVYGGTVGENPYPVYTPVAGNFPAFHVDTTPGSGSITYKIQLKLSFSGSVSFADFAERTLSVTEFRR